MRNWHVYTRPLAYHWSIAECPDERHYIGTESWRAAGEQCRKIRVPSSPGAMGIVAGPILSNLSNDALYSVSQNLIHQLDRFMPQ